MSAMPQDFAGNRNIANDFAHYRSFDVVTNSWKLDIPEGLPQRPARLNTHGREAVVALNTYNVINSPDTIVHQYDVS